MKSKSAEKSTSPVPPQDEIAAAQNALRGVLKPQKKSTFSFPISIHQGPSTSERFIKWVREDWLLKLGAFLILIGFGWFATYAFLNNWVGPYGRIGLGIFAGVAILILGQWRFKETFKRLFLNTE